MNVLPDARGEIAVGSDDAGRGWRRLNRRRSRCDGVLDEVPRHGDVCQTGIFGIIDLNGAHSLWHAEIDREGLAGLIRAKRVEDQPPVHEKSNVVIRRDGEAIDTCVEERRGGEAGAEEIDRDAGMR